MAEQKKPIPKVTNSTIPFIHFWKVKTLETEDREVRNREGVGEKGVVKKGQHEGYLWCWNAIYTHIHTHTHTHNQYK